jgi:CheY-like chemotaxis protein
MNEHHDHTPIEPKAGREAASEPPRTRVLIVDDHDVSRTVCVSYCDLFDHTSETAASGPEAVSAVKRGGFDVVVLNVHMPEMGALAAVRAIRGLPGPAGSTPIIGLAAPGRADEAQRWLAAGVSGLVAKPVTASRLFAAIRSVIEPPGGGARSWAPAG